MRLVLDKDTYEQFGMTGSASNFTPRASKGTKPRTRFNVRVDMRAESFRSGRKLFDRLRWCLQERVPPAELVFVWTAGLFSHLHCWCVQRVL
jgi:hypothetical protein